jgi:hypothetical protein
MQAAANSAGGAAAGQSLIPTPIIRRTVHAIILLDNT